MNSKLWCLAVLGVLGAPVAAQATSIVGDWNGTFQDTSANPNNGTLDLVFLTETPGSGGGFNFTGTADAVCTNTSDATCGTQGIVNFNGTLSSAGALNVLAGNTDFSGQLSGNSISGTYANGKVGLTGDWSVARVSSAPEPATLGLLGLGLAAVGYGRRKRKA